MSFPLAALLLFALQVDGFSGIMLTSSATYSLSKSLMRRNSQRRPIPLKNFKEKQRCNRAILSAAEGGFDSLDPLLLRAARGEEVERVPVWMMRQAGRHMKVYRDLVKTYPTFRERSEIPEVSLEISLQPWRAYRTDGVILFSDILTPLPGMNVDFDISETLGPVVKPYRTKERVDTITTMDPEKACPFVGQVLRALRKEVGNDATVLGFVGLPFTLATYLVEGATSKEYLEIKKMGLEQPQVLHQMLSILAENIGEYACYQIEQGAQILQVFDSWAATLSPRDYDEFCLPYQKQVISRIKQSFPETPIIIYIKQSGALLERMAASGADIVSVDWTVSLEEAKARLGPGIHVQGNVGHNRNLFYLFDRSSTLLFLPIFPYVERVVFSPIFVVFPIQYLWPL